MNSKLRVVFNMLGQLIILFSLGMLLPFLYGLLVGEYLWSLLISAVISAAVGMLLFKNGEKSLSISLSQGFVIVSFTWIFASILGSLPYYLSGQLPQWIDALFESVSGFTATGATVMLDVDSMPKGMLLYRSMTHWFGGMGIIILLLAFLKNLGPEAAHLFNAEASINGYGQIMPRIQSYALTLWLIYCVLTLTLFVLLMIAGISPFEAINYTMSIIATGGFAAHTAGTFVYADNYWVQMIMIVFMVISGGNFGLYYIGWKKGFKNIFRDTEFRVYISILAIGATAIGITLAAYHITNWHESIFYSLFTMVSIQTGSGFAVSDYDLWPPFAQVILYIAMFIGGCSGSTTGSVKVARYIFAFKAIWVYLQQMVHPGMVKAVKYNGKAVSSKKLRSTLVFLILYFSVYFFSVLLVSVTGLDLQEAMAGVAGTLGNVGLAFGELGPTNSFALVHPFAKTVFIIDMLLGRLELFTLLVMLHPGFWKAFTRKDKRRVVAPAGLDRSM